MVGPKDRTWAAQSAVQKEQKSETHLVAPTEVRSVEQMAMNSAEKMVVWSELTSAVYWAMQMVAMSVGHLVARSAAETADRKAGTKEMPWAERSADDSVAPRAGQLAAPSVDATAGNLD